MNRIFDLIIFVIVLAVLWWALTTILGALAIPEPFGTIVIVLFVLLAVFAFLDYFRSGTWFWTRRV